MNNLSDLLKNKQTEISGIIKIREKWMREGFTIVPNIFILDKRISAQAKTLFVILCMHAFNKDYAILSHELIREEFGLSSTQIKMYISELKKAKLINVIRTGRSSKYEIVFSELDNRMPAVIKHISEVRKRLELKRKEKEE